MCGFTRSMSCSNYEFSVAPGSIHGLRVAPCVGTTETPLLGFPARMDICRSTLSFDLR